MSTVSPSFSANTSTSSTQQSSDSANSGTETDKEVDVDVDSDQDQDLESASSSTFDSSSSSQFSSEDDKALLTRQRSELELGQQKQKQRPSDTSASNTNSDLETGLPLSNKTERNKTQIFVIIVAVIFIVVVLATAIVLVAFCCCCGGCCCIENWNSKSTAKQNELDSDFKVKTKGVPNGQLRLPESASATASIKDGTQDDRQWLNSNYVQMKQGQGQKNSQTDKNNKVMGHSNQKLMSTTINAESSSKSKNQNQNDTLSSTGTGTGSNLIIQLSKAKTKNKNWGQQKGSQPYCPDVQDKNAWYTNTTKNSNEKHGKGKQEKNNENQIRNVNIKPNNNNRMSLRANWHRAEKQIDSDSDDVSDPDDHTDEGNHLSRQNKVSQNKVPTVKTAFRALLDFLKLKKQHEDNDNNKDKDNFIIQFFIKSNISKAKAQSTSTSRSTSSSDNSWMRMTQNELVVRRGNGNGKNQNKINKDKEIIKIKKGEEGYSLAEEIMYEAFRIWWNKDSDSESNSASAQDKDKEQDHQSQSQSWSQSKEKRLSISYRYYKASNTYQWCLAFTNDLRIEVEIRGGAEAYSVQDQIQKEEQQEQVEFKNMRSTSTQSNRNNISKNLNVLKSFAELLQKLTYWYQNQYWHRPQSKAQSLVVDIDTGLATTKIQLDNNNKNNNVNSKNNDQNNEQKWTHDNDCQYQNQMMRITVDRNLEVEGEFLEKYQGLKHFMQVVHDVNREAWQWQTQRQVDKPNNKKKHKQVLTVRQGTKINIITDSNKVNFNLVYVEQLTKQFDTYQELHKKKWLENRNTISNPLSYVIKQMMGILQAPLDLESKTRTRFGVVLKWGKEETLYAKLENEIRKILEPLVCGACSCSSSTKTNSSSGNHIHNHKLKKFNFNLTIIALQMEKDSNTGRYWRGIFGRVSDFIEQYVGALFDERSTTTTTSTKINKRQLKLLKLWSQMLLVDTGGTIFKYLAYENGKKVRHWSFWD